MPALLLIAAMVAAVLLAGRGVALGDGGANRTLAAYRQKEDGLLVDAGFNPEEGGDFWRKEGV